LKLRKITPFGDPALRSKTKTITVFNKNLHKLIDEMIAVLNAEKNGAALAANQVGIDKSIIVINYLGERFELINPLILESSGCQNEYEGCLSLPGYSGKVSRAKSVKVKYNDRNGIEHIVEKHGDLAICFQHEIDHLTGTLFIDKMQEKYVINDFDKSKLLVSDLLLLTNYKAT
jgi:peptide deformylase